MNVSFLSSVARIAGEELRAMWRNRVTLVALMLGLLLALTASVVGYEHRRTVEADRERYQAAADQQWQAQPDRHPHRVVHYGHYVFRPLTPLAFFDTGVDAYTGHMLYLEGHRQNTANFSDARQSSVLLRLGLPTPAFVLQTLLPLLIAFLAFGCITRERERGSLRLLLVQGVSPARILCGKLAGHGALAIILASPALLALAAIAVLDPASRIEALLMIVGYALYLLLWAALAVGVSGVVPRARDALLALLGLWAALVIVLPRILPDFAAARIELPTRIETDVAVHKALAQIGDSHNPDDPYFREFRQKVLAQYGVQAVEDLPVNYGGLLLKEGERLTSELFDQHMQDIFRRQQAQSGFVDAFGLVSPVIALRRLSMSLAGTDRQTHERFLGDAEKYRYNLIQALNDLHARHVRLHNDRDQRISHTYWQSLPRFSFTPPDRDEVMRRHALPALSAILLWLILLVPVLPIVAWRLGRLHK
ncbi:MAG TPA: DUF3526 domain-containing protein [Noviherbaspirillum sp.]|jgi:ABC-2 type transport system permease protein|uniref:ABC transporter permease n=1 Tax=Noviherbaspirillum sp. TaxID=1926288 RepID=UPI002F93173F